MEENLARWIHDTIARLGYCEITQHAALACFPTAQAQVQRGLRQGNPYDGLRLFARYESGEPQEAVQPLITAWAREHGYEVTWTGDVWRILPRPIL